MHHNRACASLFGNMAKIGRPFWECGGDSVGSWLVCIPSTWIFFYNALDLDVFLVPWRRRSLADSLAAAVSKFLIAILTKNIVRVAPLHVIRKTK